MILLLHLTYRQQTEKKTAQKTSMAGAAGTSMKTEQAKPPITQNTPMMTPNPAICSGVFAKNLAEQGGMTSRAEINKSPVVFKAKATNKAVKIMKTADSLLTHTPSL